MTGSINAMEKWRMHSKPKLFGALASQITCCAPDMPPSHVRANGYARHSQREVTGVDSTLAWVSPWILGSRIPGFPGCAS